MIKIAERYADCASPTASPAIKLPRARPRPAAFMSSRLIRRHDDEDFGLQQHRHKIKRDPRPEREKAGGRAGLAAATGETHGSMKEEVSIETDGERRMRRGFNNTVAGTHARAEGEMK